MTVTFNESVLIHAVTRRIEALACSAMFRRAHFDISLEQQIAPCPVDL